VDCAFSFDNLALRVLLALTHMLLDHVRALHDNPLFLGHHRNNPASLAFVRPCDHDCLIPLLYMICAHKLVFAN